MKELKWKFIWTHHAGIYLKKGRTRMIDSPEADFENFKKNILKGPRD